MSHADRLPLSLLARLPGLGELELLGQGGFGAVYSAFDRQRNARVALKVTRTDPRRQALEATRERFLREARLLFRSSNVPGLVRVFRFGALELEEEPGGALLWYTMELCGGSLKEHLPTLPLAARVSVVLQLLDLLSYLEAWGIAHRDLKPENVFLARRPPEPVQIKLGDFGIARGTARAEDFRETLTADDLRLGSPLYMAPELLLSPEEPDLLKADQYGLALVIHCVLGGGASPLSGGFSSMSELIRVKRRGLAPLVVPGYPAHPDALQPVQRVLRRMSDLEPAQRYRDLAEAARALRSALAMADLG